MAVTQADVQVEESKVGGQLGSQDVFLDRVAVGAQVFEHGGVDAVGVHRIRGDLDGLFGILQGLVPLLLVNQHFGVEGQGQGVLGVEQVGAGGGGLGLRQVVFALVGGDQVAGGVPIQHQGINGEDGAVIGGQGYALLDGCQGF